MTRLAFAFYVGPGQFFDKAVRFVTRSPYSHVELVIDGVCHSSSVRDKGVRGKLINLYTENWEVIQMPDTPEMSALADVALAWFQAHDGEGYDSLGVARFILPFIPQSRRKWFCSEAVAASMGIPDAYKWRPFEVRILAHDMASA